MTVNTRDLLAGAIFVALGLLFALGALDLELGTAFRMGPGYFPLVLALVLIALGLAIIVQGFGHAAVGTLAPLPWRGLALIVAAPVVFGLTVRGLGLVPALAIVVLVAAFASRRMRPLLAGGLVVGLVLFCVLVFHVGLGLPIRLIGPWLGGD